MARGAAKQKPKQQPPRTTARRPGTGGHHGHTTATRADEDQMFFPRLRNHAKPVFVFLAVIFGAGFVFLGVGSGSSGLSDVLDPTQWFGGGASTTGLGSLEKKAREHPLNARAQLDYATALDGKGRGAEAIPVLEAYIKARPKDADVLSELAGRYEAQAEDEITKAQLAEYQAASVSGASLIPQLRLGKDGSGTIGSDPVVDAVTSKAQTASSEAQQAAQRAFTNDERVLKALVKAQPTDTISIIRLADAAAQTGDNPVAIENYKLFIKLAPDDPQAALARDRLKTLQTPQVSPSIGG